MRRNCRVLDADPVVVRLLWVVLTLGLPPAGLSATSSRGSSSRKENRRIRLSRRLTPVTRACKIQFLRGTSGRLSVRLRRHVCMARNCAELSIPSPASAM